ncbi:Uncharacterised protein [Collinsella aerofaciens]|uniref:Uncharacterized protein n=1 Tax=Collinsella aerofaciens TaxID=74426 RepID=A0A5K1IZV8_9ACTN|nr:Uncharacterised protein [Collinsella aerofaciens]
MSRRLRFGVLPNAEPATDYVTTDVNDDGIWNAFVHLGLIED